MLRIKILLCLTPLILAGWVAQGSFTAPMLATIHAGIDIKLTTQPMASSYPGILSQQLNANYSTNWNVVAIEPQLGLEVKDAVIFGYAYNGRWYWNNPGDLNGRSWIIWKDYNGVELFSDRLAAATPLTSLAGGMASIAQVLDTSLIRTNTLSSDPNANNWDNAVRLHDEFTALFEGSYTVIVA